MVWAAFQGHIAADHEIAATTLDAAVTHDDEMDGEGYEDFDDPFISEFLAQDDLSHLHEMHYGCDNDPDDGVDLYAEAGSEGQHCSRENGNVEKGDGGISRGFDVQGNRKRNLDDLDLDRRRLQQKQQRMDNGDTVQITTQDKITVTQAMTMIRPTIANHARWFPFNDYS